MNQYEPQIKSIIERVNKPIRITQCIQALNESEFIEYTLQSIYSEVDRIVVIEGAVKNHPKSTEDGHSTDNTIELIENFKVNKDPDKKITFIKINRHWENLEAIKQTFLDVSSDGDIIIINDCDEIFEKKDIQRIRKFFDLNPGATELIVNFLHYYGDFWHIAKPGAEWNPNHQRIFRFQRGSKYLSHPVLTDSNNQCTYFSPNYQHRRFVPKIPINVHHYGYARINIDDMMKSKQQYYASELAKHGGANKKFDQKVKYWFDKTEPVLEYDGEHPEVMQVHPNYLIKRKDLKVIGNWKDDSYYSKVLVGEEIGNIWLTMTKQAIPYMQHYHNSADV